MTTAILVDGPFSNATPASDWEEFPEWTVCAIDDDGNEIGKIYFCSSFNAAFNLGRKMANDRKLELVNEASPWF